MFSLRRHLFASYIFILLFLASVSAFSAFFLSQNEYLEENESLFVAVGLFFFGAVLACGWMIYRPLRKIIREMKALLTGRTYHRVMTTKQNEIGVLAHFFNEVTRNMENISGDVKIHQRIRKELDSAQDIQRMLIPKEAPEVPGLQIIAKTRPASEIGGDTFDFYNKGNRHLMYIGDSTGHGIPAGIVMVMVDALLETFIDLKDSLSDILISLNKYLKPHLKPTMFMTMILLEWIPEHHELKWVGGGHEYLIHLSTRKNALSTIKAGGIGVGMIADNSKLVHEQSLFLEENDFVILYSDGIVEAKNMAGETYDLKRLANLIQSQTSESTSPEDLFQKIAVDVGRFMQGQVQLDDMTLFVLKHTPKRAVVHEKNTEWNSREKL